MVVHQPASAYQLLVPGGTPFAGSLPSRGDSGVTSFTFSIDPGVIGRASRPVVHHPRRGNSEPPYLTTYLLVQA